MMSEVFNVPDEQNRDVFKMFVNLLFSHMTWLHVKESY